MSTQVLHSEEEVVEWINYYQEGNDIPDDIMVKLLHMAQLQAKQKDLMKAFHAELSTMKWMGADEGWDLAIDAVQKRIEELLLKETK